jgi:NADPH:quinone reductase-like Zn-dependent oxidoreductase
MSTTIRKALVPSFGDYTHISIVDAEIFPPVAKEVQVKVLYSGMAGADINMRMGTYPLQKKAPLTPGYCLVGRVHINGPGCSKFKTGDLVVCLSIYDSESELVNLPEKFVIAAPEDMDLQQIVPMILDWNTAYGMVNRCGKVVKGQRVFIHGLSGAVGYAALTFCLLNGAEVYGTASESNHAALREAGAIPFVYSNKDWIMAMNTIGGAHAVFDALGFESFDESWSILAPEGGHLVAYGANLNMLNGDEKTKSVVPSIGKLLARNLVPFCPHKSSFYYIARDSKYFESELQACFTLVQEGKITAPIKKVWDLEDIQEAHRTWTQTKGVGSVLIKIADDVKV